MDISAADAEEGRRMDRNGQGQEPLPTFEGGYIKKQHGPGHGYTVNVARGQ